MWDNMWRQDGLRMCGEKGKEGTEFVNKSKEGANPGSSEVTLGNSFSFFQWEACIRWVLFKLSPQEPWVCAAAPLGSIVGNREVSLVDVAPTLTRQKMFCIHSTQSPSEKKAVSTKIEVWTAVAWMIFLTTPSLNSPGSYVTEGAHLDIAFYFVQMPLDCVHSRATTLPKACSCCWAERSKGK